MKRIFFLMALFGLFTMVVQAQTPSQTDVSVGQTNANAAEFKFEEDTHDFGEVAEGPNAVTEFKFKNVGKEPLIITNAKASCGCTVPKWPREPILPGQEASITVSYTTKGRKGAINKTITITSNAKTPTKLLRITGKVIPAEPASNGNPEQNQNMLKVN